MYRNSEIFKFIETEILPKISNFDQPDIAKKLTRVTKRFANMILADGLLKALLFAFSKAKVETIASFILTIERNHGSKTVSEDKDAWGLLVWFVAKVLNRLGSVSNEELGDLEFYQLISFLKKVESQPKFVERYIVAHLDILAKFFESLVN